MTVLNDIIPLSIDMMKDELVGTYNMCNPGTISHNEILQLYKEIVNGSFTWKNFTEEEQSQVLLSGRSNNGLCDEKLSSYKKIPHIHTSVRNILHLMKNNRGTVDTGARFV